MSYFSFFTKFSAVLAAGYAMVFAAANIVTNLLAGFALNAVGYALIGLDVFALVVWVVNAVWYSE